MINPINACGCGSQDITVFRYGGETYRVACLECGMFTSHHNSEQEAIFVWNNANKPLGKLSQAMKWLEDGKKIRGTCWDKTNYIVINQDGRIAKQDGGIYTESILVISLITWELYNEMD